MRRRACTKKTKNKKQKTIELLIRGMRVLLIPLTDLCEPWCSSNMLGQMNFSSYGELVIDADLSLKRSSRNA
jgi:hypothetical protein